MAARRILCTSGCAWAMTGLGVGVAVIRPPQCAEMEEGVGDPLKPLRKERKAGRKREVVIREELLQKLTF